MADPWPFLDMSQKRKLDPISSAWNLSLAAYGKIMGESRDHLSQDLAEYSELATRYGKLVMHISLPEADPGSEPVQLPIVSPFALLHSLCYTSRRFPAFLSTCVGSVDTGNIFYTDEVSPGNQPRPDSKGSLHCFYLTSPHFLIGFAADSMAGLPLPL